MALCTAQKEIAMCQTTPDHAPTLLALQEAWHSHQLLLSALLQLQNRWATHLLKEDSGQPEHYRRLLLRLIADQAALGYDSVTLQQQYEQACRHWGQQCGMHLPNLLWQWRHQQQQRQQRILLTLTRATLESCQLRLASEPQAA
jgi:hypothetical protein